jgi:hypothetical protein
MGFKIDTSNYFRQRRRRAELLCDHLGDCAEYIKESITTETRMNFFTSFEDAVDQISSVSKDKSVKFLVHQVTKSKGKWGVSYKTMQMGGKGDK